MWNHEYGEPRTCISKLEFLKALAEIPNELDIQVVFVTTGGAFSPVFETKGQARKWVEDWIQSEGASDVFRQFFVRSVKSTEVEDK